MPETIVVDGDKAVGKLESVAEEPQLKVSVHLTTVGDREIHARVISPSAYKAGKKYPVIVDVYGGPHALTVQQSLAQQLLPQWIADHGFVVVSFDGRGTPWRGRDWERAIGGKVGTVPLEDQIYALKALLEEAPEMDLSRVGVMGWSYGGYMAGYAILRRPDVFHAAVAGAPVVDWRDYDTAYTERYLGLPEEKKADYDDSSLLTHADKLSRPLLLIHGTRDDNVYFFHTLKLAEALFRAGKKFDFLPLAGFTHMVPDPQVRISLNERIIQHFTAALRP
jgi:dipeptidyl-peptidase-4